MTGLIYVAIIAVWAIVLVPAWLRRQDHLDPERSVDRFTRTMETLASRPSVLGTSHVGHDEHEHVDPAPEVLRITRPDLSTATARAGRPAPRAGGRVRPRSAVARRRTVLQVLVIALLAVAGLVASGVLLPIAIAVPAGLIVTFLAVARHQVSTAGRARRAGSRAAATHVSAPAPTARSAAGASGSTWEARTAPLPTYVTAPPAAGFPRVIDTQTPGAWTAAAMLERAQQEKARAERMAAAKAEAIARAKAEQAAAEARSRDEEFLTQQSAQWPPQSSAPYRRRAVNE